MRTHKAAALVALATLAVVGCSDDDGGESADASAYCELAAELDASDTQPTDAQLDEIVRLADDEIRDDVEAFAEAVRTGEYPPGIEQNEQAIADWESENCGDTFGGEQEEPAADE